MRSSICGAVGLAAVGLLTLAPISASAQKAESGLLGNKLWNTFDQVLRKHGQPTRIEIGAATGGGQAAAPGGGGMMGGGAPYGAGGPPGMGAGGPGGGGSPYGGGIGQQMAAQMQRMYGGGGGPGGKMGGGSPYGGGLPGVGGMQTEGLGGSGPYGAGGPPGMASGGGMAGGGQAASSGDEGEITWVYEKGLNTDIFLFNKDGRLIQVSSFGYAGGAVTGQGVRLGDPIGKIYGRYGWTHNISKDPQRGTMTLDYSKDHHVAFQLAERGKVYRVVGITVGITELSQLNVIAPGMNFSNARQAGGGMGMMGGPMGGPSMMGSSGMMGGGMRRQGGKLGGGGGGAAETAN